MSSVYESASLSKSRFRMFSLRGEETALSILTPRTRCGMDKLFWTFEVVSVLFGCWGLKALGNLVPVGLVVS